ncbi:hypothetical protein [Candidatus Atelocyanobacterium thalassae]|uniref:hypothetical protein n=1 Tax=Candidatus Atelocyanobacterium thalassae TaxID=713887 RepID=UPI001E5ADA49|nr:hypothetical protein [Candidatus Atelocyanobacterium thalassa]
MDKDKYISKLSKAEQLEIEQKKNVILLVENLMEREEITIKMIIDCLYDVGSVNFVDKKFRLPSANKILKVIARLSKPSFRTIAFYWGKKIAPELITDWLLQKIKF